MAVNVFQMHKKQFFFLFQSFDPLILLNKKKTPAKKLINVIITQLLRLLFFLYFVYVVLPDLFL